MALKDFSTFLNELELPIMGKTYRIPAVSAELGVKLVLLNEQAAEVLRIMDANQEAAEAAEKAGKPAPEPEPFPDYEIEENPSTPEALLGDVYDEMVADGVPYRAIRLASETAQFDFLYGREAAEAFWNSEGDPKAVARALPGSNSFSTSGGAETTTQKRASTSGTKSRTKTSRSTTAAKPASGTRKSSQSGDSSKPRSKQS